MKDQNPLIPSGSTLEQLQRRKTKVLSTVFVIVAAHVLPITGLLLMQGCKPDAQSVAQNETEASPANNEQQKPPVGDDELYGQFAMQNDPNKNISMPINDETNGDKNPIKEDPDSPVAPVQAPDLDTNISNGWVLKEQSGGPAESATTQNSSVASNSVPTKKVEEVKKGMIEHKIKPGDMLSKLATQYDSTLKDILEANPGVDPRSLRVGYKLFIPQGTAAKQSSPVAAITASAPVGSGKVYVIKAGDNLSRIATAHGVSLEALRTANNISSHIIHPGQKLVIPVKTIASGK